MKIITREQMMTLDHRTIHEAKISERELIKRAGTLAAKWIASRYNRDQFEIWVLIGKGNNGADAKVAARELKKKRFVIRLFNSWEISTKNLIAAQQKTSRKVIIIDGVFGTGLNRKVGDPYASIFAWITTRRFEVVALDIPSGLDANTGKPLSVALAARTTLTFGLPKMGLVSEEAANEVGELHVLDIGFPQRYMDEIITEHELIVADDVGRFFSERKRNSHKGSSGHVLVIGGSKGFAGAAALAARSALRSGAGLVSLLVPDGIYRVESALSGPEVMVHAISREGRNDYLNEESIGLAKKLLAKATSVVVGPGLGQHRSTFDFVRQLFPMIKVPVVLDADGLNLVAQKMALLKQLSVPTILTPHPGEMARLAASTRDQVQNNREKFAKDFVQTYRKTLVLKGSRTLIAHAHSIRREDGTFIRYSVNALSGNPGMAVGGAGDVLSGILGALLARGLSEFDASRAGVFLHGRAGDLSMSLKGGNTAGDLIAALPKAISSL